MKSLILCTMMMSLIFPVMAQEDTTDVETGEKYDTTHIRIGNKGLNIVEKEDGTSIDVVDVDVDVDDDADEEKEWRENKSDKHRSRKFEGHWEGIELGMANFVDADYSMSRSGDARFMDLHTGKSFNVNINITQYDIGLGTSYLGLVTGLGLEFSSYFFDGNNSIIKDEFTGEIEPDYSYTGLGINLDKSKLVTTYLTVPLLLEGQVGSGSSSKRFRIAAGVIGGLKIGSHTKVVYRQSGSKEKDKDKDDFNLNALRYGFTARMGYKSMNIYANYYPTPIFEKGKGPELYPFAVGLGLSF
ncbi:MAG: hypothetical protein ACOC0C_07540 [Bacteroidota bacterium]